MYTTLHLKKCFEKGKQQKAMNYIWSVAEKIVQLNMAVSELNNSKRLAKKIVKPSTLWNNNFVKILKWADN